MHYPNLASTPAPHATYFESIGLPLDELLADELGAAGWVDDDRLTIEATTVTEARPLSPVCNRLSIAPLIRGTTPSF